MTKHVNRTQTTFAKTSKDNQRDLTWFQIDAAGKTLGRLASEAAQILRGKHSVQFTPHIDMGDGVVILNADKIVVTGHKEAQKEYHTHSGKPGGLKTTPYSKMNKTEVVRHAVKGMMPKTKLGKSQLTRLRIFNEEQHTLEAQKPISVAM